MNLDLLISKYLDGDLSEHEDILLRNLIKDDDHARFQFESAVDLHLSMVEDSETIIIPEKLKTATRDKVLMKIMAPSNAFAASAVNSNVSQIEQNSVFRYLVAATLLFFVFTGAINLYEFNDSGNRNIAFNEVGTNVISSDNNVDITIANTNDVSRESVQNNLIALDELNNSESKAKQSAISFSKTENIDNNTVYYQSNNFVAIEERHIQEVFAAVFQSDASSETTARFYFSKRNDFTQDNINMNNRFSRNGNPIIIESNLDEIINFNRIIVSTNTASDLLRVGFNDDQNTISHYSYSFGYGINENSSFGIEAGYSMYSYSYNINFNNPNQDVIASSVEVPGDNPSFAPPSVPINRETSIFWGALFYDRNLVSFGDFSVDGRLAFGANSYGLLTYGRLNAGYKFFNFLKFNVGLDNRVFRANPHMQLNDGFLNSTSLIYGVQIDF